MVDWKITATTIYCDAVCDEVTLMVRNDWSTRCVGYDKYGKPRSDAAAWLKKRSQELNRPLGCEGLECSQLAQYKQKLLGEESRKAPSGGGMGASPQGGAG